MSSPQVRQRGPKEKQPAAESAPLMNGKAAHKLEQAKKAGKDAATKDWDYKLALLVITALAFATRFYGISHPNQVVFDEVHFGKVQSNPIAIAICRETPRLTWTALTVCLVLPPTHLLLRCPPPFRQAPLRIRRLAGWLRWSLSL